MNLLTVIHYPVFSGPHNRVLRMAPLLRDSGWQSWVIIPDEEGNGAMRLRSGDCTVIPIRLHRLRNKLDPKWMIQFVLNFYGDIKRIRNVIRERDIDLVLIGGLVNPHGGIAARLEGVPVIWQIIDTRNSAPLRRLIMPVVTRLANGLMFGGEALIKLHVPSGPLSIPIAVCPPPVDTSRFHDSDDYRRSTRASLGIPPQAKVVGMVANLNPQKGIEYFVRAATLIAKQRSETYFLIVGATYETHADYRELIDEEISQSGISPDKFLLAGPKDDVETCYPAMNVKLITSVPRSEGTTTTAMEAMACGVPVVATDVGAVKEVVLDGVTGLIVPPLDPERIASATLQILDDPELASRMGIEGRQRAVEAFDVKVSLDRYLSIFEKAVDNLAERQSRA